MNQRVQKEIDKLESLERPIIELGKQMLSADIFPLDLLSSGVMDRSLHLIFGFTSLIKGENYIAAAHLVRCHLDNILRFSAAWIVEDPHHFASEIIAGKKVEEIKDQKGHLLKDWYLRNKLSEEYPWVENVYKESSGFIHLSKKHIFTSSKLVDKQNRTVQFRISKTDNYVPDEARIEAVQCMSEITLVLMKYIEGWIWTKNNPGKTPE